MTGAIINASGIILGAGLALLMKKPLSPHHQRTLKVGLGALTVFFGLKLTFTSLHGGFGQIAKQFGIVLLAMVLGKVIGRLMRIQKGSNALGQFASRKMAGVTTTNDRFNDGFIVCTALFCAAPLSILASVHEGMADFSSLFVVKAVMDGAAAMAFTSMFGPGVLLSALPVLALQSALTRGALMLTPWLKDHSAPMLDTILATDGMLIFCVALIILQLKRIEIADYLPSLAIAPLLVWWMW